MHPPVNKVDKKSAAHCDVVVVRFELTLPLQHLDALVDHGFHATIAEDAAAAEKQLATSDRPILLVECGLDEEKVSGFIKQVIQSEGLRGVPAVFVGRDADSFERVLSKYYKSLVTLTLPCSGADLFSALNYCALYYADQTGAKARRARRHDRSDDSPPEGTAAAVQVVQAEISRDSREIPTLVFEQYGQLNLFRHFLEGLRYTRGINQDDLAERGLMPAEQRLRHIVLAIADDLGKWGRGHMYRTAFLASKIADPLPFTPKQREDLKLAALLFSWAFVRSDKKLLRLEYAGPRNLIIRKDLCSKLKDSAMRVILDLTLPGPGAMIGAFARLVGKEDEPEEALLTLSGAVLMAADLVDRICFADGCWNPRAAYHLFKRCRHGKVKDIPPEVMACVIKLLSEAITGNPRLITPKRLRDNEEMKIRAALARDAVTSAWEQKVPLDKLVPGMKLSRPLETYDGRKLLESDVVFDQDLIWRLWQLASIRPLNGPAIIVQTH